MAIKINVEFVVQTQAELGGVLQGIGNLGAALPENAQDIIARQLQAKSMIDSAVAKASKPAVKVEAVEPEAVEEEAPAKAAKPAKAPKAEKPAKAAKAAKVEEAEEEEITIETVKEKLTELVDSNDDGFDKAQAILKKYKAKTIKEIDSAHYGNVVEDAEAALAAIKEEDGEETKSSMFD